jgi:hypothetical protein
MKNYDKSEVPKASLTNGNNSKTRMIIYRDQIKLSWLMRSFLKEYNAPHVKCPFKAHKINPCPQITGMEFRTSRYDTNQNYVHDNDDNNTYFYHLFSCDMSYWVNITLYYMLR